MKQYNERQKTEKKASGRGLRREWAISLFCLLMATALPALTALAFRLSPGGQEPPINEKTTVTVYRHGGAEETESEEMTLERLLTLSLAATNRSDTPAASWEAQAVLLRSRAVWWLDYCAADLAAESGKGGQSGSSFPRAVRTLCDSPTHGLPYRSEKELTAALGERETKLRITAAREAVRTTTGRVLCYEGEVIPALLHHSSSGVTRTVEDLPWLASVPTPEPPFRQEVSLDAKEVRVILAARFGVILPDSPAEWGLSLQLDGEGRAEQVQIGTAVLSAVEFAGALALPSADFTVEVREDALRITCTGSGSGCGLSREGASLYAANGLCMAEILAHYYPDCTLGELWE